MKAQELREKIEKMRKGLANPAIQGATRTALEASLTKAVAQLDALPEEQEKVAQAAAPEQKKPAETPVCGVTRNLQKNGIEIKFPKPVSPEISAALKGNGFRWSKFQKLWYATYSEERHQWANDLCEMTEHGENPAAIVPKNARKGERLITKSALTSRGRVPQHLLKKEIEAGKLEMAMHRHFDSMRDIYDYVSKDKMVWKDVTMNDDNFDIKDLRNGSANNHWSNAIRLQDDGTITFGSVTFRYKPVQDVESESDRKKIANSGSPVEILIAHQYASPGDIVLLDEDLYDNSEFANVQWGIGSNMRKYNVRVEDINFDLGNLKYPKGQLLKAQSPAPKPNLFDPNNQQSHTNFKPGDTVRIIHLEDVNLGAGQRGESPYNLKIGQVIQSQPNDVRVVIAGLTDDLGEGFLPNTLEKLPSAPKFKKGDTALYNDKVVKILSDGNYDTVARYYIYLAKAQDWDDSDNVGEPYLSQYNEFQGFSEELSSILANAQKAFDEKPSIYPFERIGGQIRDVADKFYRLLPKGASAKDYPFEKEINAAFEKNYELYEAATAMEPPKSMTGLGAVLAVRDIQRRSKARGEVSEEDKILLSTISKGKKSAATLTEGFKPGQSVFKMLGRKIKILLPNGEERSGQFAIVELDSITASHNERTFASSAGYPVNAQGRNANDRNYEGDKQAQALVQEYARDLKPELLITTSRTPEGTPIITQDGIVVSGNNRTMSLKLAAAEYPEKFRKYRDFLTEEMASFGFSESESEIQSYNQPVLVRIDYDIPEVNTNELAKYNQSTTKGARPIDKSIALSARLSETLCGTNIPQIIGEFDTLSEFYADRNAQKRVKDQMIGCGLLTQQEVPSVYGEGQFNEEGKTFIERTLGAAVLTADALQAAEADGVKALRKVVVNALPVLLENKGLPSDASLIAYVNEAIIFQQKMVSSKLSFGDYLGQKSIFDTDSAAHSRQAVVLNRLMNTGQRVFKTAVGKYNQTAKENAGASLFGDSDKVTPDQAFEGLIVSALPDSERKVIERQFSMPVKQAEKSNTEKINAAIEALRETMQFVEDTLAKSKIQAAIEALETTLAFM